MFIFYRIIFIKTLFGKREFFFLINTALWHTISRDNIPAHSTHTKINNLENIHNQVYIGLEHSFYFLFYFSFLFFPVVL